MYIYGLLTLSPRYYPYTCVHSIPFLHHCKHIILKVATAYLKVNKNLKIPAILTLTNLFKIKYLFKKLLNINNAKQAFLKVPIDAYHG